MTEHDAHNMYSIKLMKMHALVFLASSCLLASVSTQAQDMFVLAKDGWSLVSVYAPKENQWAGKRLADRLERVTGAKVRVGNGTDPPKGENGLIAVGTRANNPVVKAVLEKDERVDDLGEEGYILKMGRWNDLPVLVAAGNTLAQAHQDTLGQLALPRLGKDAFGWVRFGSSHSCFPGGLANQKRAEQQKINSPGPQDQGPAKDLGHPARPCPALL